MNADTYKHLIQNVIKVKLGKTLPDALYVHRSALDLVLESLAMDAHELASEHVEGLRWNLAKFSRSKPAISLLWYPGFDSEAHPALHRSVHINLETGEVTSRSYVNAKNAPILHRKELFLLPNYPLYNDFVALTGQEEEIGLLKECSKVGFRNQWELRCSDRGVSFCGNRMVQET